MKLDPTYPLVMELPQDVLLQAALTYIQAFEITGTAFALPDPSRPPLARIQVNLRKFIR